MSDAPERILSLLRKYDEYNNIIDMYGYCYYVGKMKKVRSEIIELFSGAQKWRECLEWMWESQTSWAKYATYIVESDEESLKETELFMEFKKAESKFRALEKELRESHEKEAV